MRTINDIKKYFEKKSYEYCYPHPEVYRGFAESVCKEDGDIACLAFAEALQRYVNLKSSEIYYSDSCWSKINIIKIIEMLDKFGVGELKPEESNFGMGI